MYTTVDELYQFIAGIDSTNQKIPATEFLTPLLVAINNEINSKLSSKYFVPITVADSPIAFSILKFIAIDLCREKVAQRLNWKTYNTETLQTPNWMASVENAKKNLEAIRIGSYPLSDALSCGAACEAYFAGYYDTSDIPGRPDDGRYRRPSYRNNRY